MPKCRICGCEFEVRADTGYEICAKIECFKEAYRRAVAPLKKKTVPIKAAPARKKYNKRVSEEDKQRIMELFRNNVSRRDISDRTGISYPTVCRIIKNAKNKLQYNRK